LTSGKHPPGITNDACSGPGPLHRYVACGPRLRWFWAIVPFHVGRDYAMWATITVKQKMRPHQNGIPAHITPESVAHIQWNHRPTSTGIRTNLETFFNRFLETSSTLTFGHARYSVMLPPSTTLCCHLGPYWQAAHLPPGTDSPCRLNPV